MKKLLVNFILDETGSMQSIKDRTISGFNEYLDTLKPKGKIVHFTLTKFNSEKVDIVCNDVPVKEVPYLNAQNYIPEAMTPLYDAIGNSIKAIEKKFKGRVDKPNVLCVIMTDGAENYSKEYTREKIYDLIKQKEETKEWTFTYLGANQDSWLEGDKIGTQSGNVLDWSADNAGTARAYAVTCAATSNFVDEYIGSSGLKSYTNSFYQNIDDKQVAKFEAKILKKGGEKKNGRKSKNSL